MSELALDLMIGAKVDNSFNDVRKMIADMDQDKVLNISGDFDKLDAQAQKSFQAMSKDMFEMTRRAIGTGLNQGFTGVKELGSNLLSIQDEILKSQQRAVALREQYEAASSKREKEAIALQIEGEEKRSKALVARYRKEIRFNEQVIQRREQGIREVEAIMKRSASENAKALVAGAGEAVEKLSNFQGLDLAGAVRGGGDTVKALGQKLEKVGAATAAKGTNQLVRGMGNLIAKIGPAVAAFGAFVGGMAAVVKVIIDADAQTKELNRSILSQVSVANLMTGRAENLQKSLEGVRDAAVSWRNNMEWGTTAQEQVQILNAFNEAGFTFREMANQLERGKNNMYAYQKATEAALVYSKLLGVSAQEIATNMADMMEELGTSLQGIRERFGAVFEAASLSGFSAKRFYGIVLEATSGMAMYNVRLEEAAGLLTKLGKILGKKVAPEFLKNITDMFKSDDIPTRFKKIMLAGRGNMAGIFAKSAQNIANDFLDKFKNLGSDLGKMGIKGFDKIKGADDLVKHLQKLKPEQQQKLIARVGVHNADMARQLENLTQVSKGSTGKLGDMALHLDSLDLGGKMQFALTQASSLFKKPIHQLSAIQTAGFAQATGMSMEQIKQLRRVSRRMTGNFKVLEAQRDRMAQLYKAAQGGDKTAQKQLAGLMAQQHKQAASMGAMVTFTKDGQAKIVAATVNSKNELVKTKKEIKTQQDLVQSSGEAFKKAAKEGAPEQIQLARQTATQTRDMTHILKAGVQYWLEQISKQTSFIANWLPGGLSKTEKARKQVLINQTQEQIKATKTQQDQVSKKLSELKTQAASEKGAAREKTEAQIKKLTGVQKALEFQKTNQTKTLDSLRDIRSSSNWISNMSKDQISKRATGAAAGDILRQQGMGAELKRRQDQAIQAEKAKRERTGQVFSMGQVNAKDEEKIRKKIAKEMLEEENKKTQQTLHTFKEEGKKSREDQKKEFKNLPDKNAQAQTKEQRKLMLQQLMQSKFGGGITRADQQAFLQTGRLGESIKKAFSQKVVVGQGTADERTTTVGQLSTNNQNAAAFGIALANAAKGAVSSQDFLLSVTEGGKISLINRFSSSDRLSVLGTKPGGAIASAVGAGAGGPPGVGGGGNVVNVNVTINGNEEKAYNVVRRALQTAGVA